MPRSVHMRYIASEHRWKKMYRGILYKVSCRQLGTEPTQAASLLAANRWWESKLTEITGTTTKPQAGTPEAQHKLLEAWAGMPLETPEDTATAAAGFMEEYSHNPIPPTVLQAMIGPERVAQLEHGVSNLLEEPTGPVEKTIGALVDLWVRTEAGRVKAGKLGISRANMNRVCLHHFQDWVGAHTAAETINEAKWLEWYAFLAGHPTWKVGHLDRIFGVSKRFIRFLWELRMIELPRNIDNRNLSFTVGAGRITIWTPQEINAFLGVTTGQTPLHVLLMLNCGFVGKDISDLRHGEVDWQEGIITRKRSKTRKEAGVPVVRYKLWQRTFDLLKRHRSSDQDIVLMTTTGQRWITERDDGEYHRSDKVASNFKYWMKRAKMKKPPKALRATGASMLAEHPQYKFYAQYYLGQSPRTVADKHYVKPNDREFFEALGWLEGAMGISDRPA